MSADQRGENGDDRLVSFRNWNEVLEAAPLALALKTVYRQEIVAFLRFCKVHHAGASIILVKQYLAVAERQGRTQAREALRWWFRAAKGGAAKGGAPQDALKAEGLKAGGGRSPINLPGFGLICSKWRELTRP